MKRSTTSQGNGHSSAKKKQLNSPVLTIQTQLRLKKLLMILSKTEQKLESKRQSLSAYPQMDPYSLFQRIDRDQDSYIQPVDILHFLRENDIFTYSEAECYYLVQYFDADQDNLLNYAEFMQIILPCDNPMLRAVVTQRETTQVKEDQYLDDEIELELSRIFTIEIILHKKLEKIRQELHSSIDFNEDSIYLLMDDWNYGYIDQKNLAGFFRNHKYLATASDCKAILRRLDQDGDSRIQREEFIATLRPREPFSKKLVKDEMDRNTRLQSVKKFNQIMEQKGRKHNKMVGDEVDQDTLKTSALDRGTRGITSTSPLKCRPADIKNLVYEGSPFIDNNINYKSQNSPVSAQKSQKKSALNVSRNCMRRSLNTPMRKTIKPNSKQQLEFMEVQTKTMQELESQNNMNNDDMIIGEVEVVDQPKVQKPIFDNPSDSKGLQSTMRTTYTNGLLGSNNTLIQSQQENLTPTKQNSNSNSNQQNASRRMNFEPLESIKDFNTPSQNSIRVQERPQSKQVQLQQSSKPQTNSPNLEQIMISTFKEQIEYERIIESVKIDLAQKDDFNLIDAFRIFDTDAKGWVTPCELQEAFKQYSLYIPFEDIQLFMRRYDKDEDGRLKYSEFCDSFLPCESLYAAKLARKAPYYQYSYPRSTFSEQTRELFLMCWKLHFINETDAEKLRHSLKSIPEFNLYQAFKLVDLKNDGVIDLDEISQLLTKCGENVNESEISALIDRYDRKRDGKITYSEFVTELTPRFHKLI